MATTFTQMSWSSYDHPTMVALPIADADTGTMVLSMARDTETNGLSNGCPAKETDRGAGSLHMGYALE